MATNTTSSTAAQPLESSLPQEKPARDMLYWLGVVMALLGIGVSGYLVYVKLADVEAVCVESGAIDCASVQDSVYSEILGIPIALLGFGAYLAILGLFLLEERAALVTAYGRTLLFGMTLFGVVYSGYLSYIEGFVLKKWCLWCVSSAILMVGLFVIATTRVVSSFEEEEDEPDEEDVTT